MSAHKHGRTTYKGRKSLMNGIAVMGLMAAAEAAAISLRTARKWRQRFDLDGLAGLVNRSSRPARTRTTLDAALLERIEVCDATVDRCA